VQFVAGGGMKNVYQILGVGNFAPMEAVKVRYRQLALQYHPDRAGVESTKKMQVINEAFEILRRDKTQYDYNLKLALGLISREPVRVIVRQWDWVYGSDMYSGTSSTTGTY
jgi:curved DNA-binding protein CbpA